MSEEEAIDNREMDQKMKSKSKSKNGEKKEHGDVVMREVEQARGTERDGIIEMKVLEIKDKEKKKKNKRKEDDGDGEGNVMDTVEEEMVDVNGEDSNGDGINNVERKKRKKEKNKRKHEVGGSIEGINENEGQERPEEESVSKMKSNSEAHEEEKNQNEMSSREDAVEKVERKKRKREKKKLDKADDSFGLVSNENSSGETVETLNEGRSDYSTEKVKKKEKKKKKRNKNIARNKDDEGVLPVLQNENTRENVEGSPQPALLEENVTSKDGAEKVERRKRKREKKFVKDDDCFSRAGNKNSSVEILETLNEGRSDNLAEKVEKKEKKKKDKKIGRSKDDEGVLAVLQNEDMGENVEGSPQPAPLEKNATSKIDKKKRSKKDNSLKDVPSVAKEDIPMQESVDKNSNGQSSTDVQRNEEVEFAKRKKKKAKLVESVPEGPAPAKSNKKVRFSEEVEVFTLPDDPNTRNDGKDKLVQGKRFTKEEDEIVKEAVWNYIAEHELGDKGLDMVLNSRKHPQLRGCWKEIAAAIPYRPYSAFYARAQILFRRSEERKWTEEEKRILLEYHEVHGNKWKELADELGKHRWHVKDAWRRMKFPNFRKGHWTQEEYQKLFDLVNKDLQLKAEEEKKSKHGMLRDNIAWSAISDQLSTRSNEFCCKKWYDQLRSPMVVKGVWADADDYRLVGALYNIDASCGEDVEWDDLLDDRSGELCLERWNQMVLHIGEHGTKSFAEQVEILARRYCSYIFEVREAWDNKPVSN